MEGEDIAFYAVPYMATRANLSPPCRSLLIVNGKPEMRRIPMR